MKEPHIVSHEFQVNFSNGDIDFITVYDLPYRLAEKFVSDKYPSEKIEFYETVNNPIEEVL